MHRAGLAAQARIFTMSRRHFVSALQRTPLFLLACWRSGHPIKVWVPSPIFLRVLTIQIIVLTVVLSLGFGPHVSGIKYRHGPLQIMHTSARSWISPISGKPHVIHAFIKPSQRWSAGHRGVDLEATEQDQVRAPAPGTIVFSGTVVDRQVVVIEHPNGYRSSFEPVTDPLPVTFRRGRLSLGWMRIPQNLGALPHAFTGAFGAAATTRTEVAKTQNILTLCFCWDQQNRLYYFPLTRVSKPEILPICREPDQPVSALLYVMARHYCKKS